MQEVALVRVNKYSKKIKELGVEKRVSVDYPLLCRNEVAKKLAIVANNLQGDLLLQIDSAYRTKLTQTLLWNFRKIRSPELVHNPEAGQSPHCTGGAIDVSIAGRDGKELNLSEPSQKFYDEPQLISNKITPKAQELRNLLNKLMVEAGFAPNLKEYWHFSYGDESWARYSNREVLYDEIDLDSNLYYPFLKRLYYKILRKLWKLTNKIFGIQTNY